MSQIDSQSVIEPLEMSPALSSEEGFLWSRVQGKMSVDELAQLCPWPKEKVIELLEALEAKNSIKISGRPAKKAAPKPKKKAKQPPKQVSSSSKPAPELPKEAKEMLEMDQMDPVARDMSLEFRTKILEILYCPDPDNPFEVLRLRLGASDNEIRQRYLELSRKFHPDRFFRAKLGHYQKKLDKVFTLVQKAYSQIKNPYDREVVLRKLRRSTEPPKEKASRKLDPQIERIGKAEHYFKLGLEAERAQDYRAAAGQYRLALELNPKREQYQKAFQRMEPYLGQSKAEKIVAQAAKAMEVGLYDDALESCEEAIEFDPENPEAQLIAGKAIIKAGHKKRFDEAIEYLRHAKSKLSKEADCFFYLAKLYLLKNKESAARKELDECLKRDPSHAEANKLLSKLET